MVWSLSFDTGFSVTYSVEALDGDRKKIEYVDRTPDPGAGGLFKPGQLSSGRRVKQEFVPTKVVWGGPKRLGIPEALFGQGMQYVNQRFRDIVEGFEPGVHQFFPLEILWKDWTFAQDMFFFNVCNRLDSLDHELSTAEISKAGFLRPETGTWVFNKNQIGNHHIWWDKYIYKGLYVSDELRNALVEAGVTGLLFTEQPSVGEA